MRPKHFLGRIVRQTCTDCWDLAEWLERRAVNANIAAVLGSIPAKNPASSDTVESERRQIKQRWVTDIEREKIQKIPF